MEYLHTLGIVYRDLKPKIFLLCEDGHVMVSDFDLYFRAHVAPTFDEFEFVAEPTTVFSKLSVGTHGYLAPMLVSGNSVTVMVTGWTGGLSIFSSTSCYTERRCLREGTK
nr:serine/threonine-protein kinase wag2 [Quercus suber]